MKKIPEERMEELINEVDEAFHKTRFTDPQSFLERIFKKIAKRKTDKELFYCGLILDSILVDHGKGQEEEKPIPRKQKQRYVN